MKSKNKTLEIYLKNKKVNVLVIYSNRKTASIKINLDKHIEIRVPNNTKDENIYSIIDRKSNWISKTIDKKLDYEYVNRSYKEDSKFMYLGNEYSITILNDEGIKNDYVKVDEAKNKIEIHKNKKLDVSIPIILEKWYKIESEKLVESRSILYIDKVGIVPTCIKVKKQKNILGTCTSLRKVYINSNIAMAPIYVIDYVIVHELCHLIHMNHSKEFYSLVNKIYPKYDEAILWIKENGYKINLNTKNK